MTSAFPGGVLLTGRPGSGKTTALRRTVTRLVDAGVHVTGFVTDEVREHGTRVGFDLITLTADGHDGARHVLARVGMASPVAVGRYGVDRDAVAAALPALAAPADVVVVDEIAPMELQAPAFRTGIEQLLEGSRPLLATVHARAGGVAARVRAHSALRLIEVAPRTRDRLPQEVATMLLRCLPDPQG